jgi:hypothetical protein
MNVLTVLAAFLLSYGTLAVSLKQPYRLFVNKAIVLLADPSCCFAPQCG